MKISLIIPSFFPATVYGGPIYSTLYTSKELAKLNHQIFVSTTNSNFNSRLNVPVNKFIELENNLYVKYYNETFVNRFSAALYVNINRDIKNVDIVHLQAIFNTPTPIALFWANFYNKPLLLSPRGALGDWVMNHGIKFKSTWISLLIKPFSDRIYWHATSEQEKTEIQSHFPEAKVFIVPNGLNIQEFSPFRKFSKVDFIKKYARIEANPDHIIISMGRLQKKKGFDILIKAFSEILIKFNNSYLFIAGQDEGEKEALLKLIHQLRLSNRVFLIGELTGSDKIEFLGNADLFVLPSHNENFGNVYAESLASGTPIVASLYTPWKEVENYNCGRCVGNSVGETADAISYLLEKDLNEMGINGKEYVKRFSWEEVAKKFESIFNTILKQKNGRL
ncbi:MAG: glycosyltransferase [Cytophagaceae bacterium]